MEDPGASSSKSNSSSKSKSNSSGQMAGSASIKIPCATFARHHTLAAASLPAPISHVAVKMPACDAPAFCGVTNSPYGSAIAPRNKNLSANGISRLPSMTSPVAFSLHGSTGSHGARAWWYTRSSPPYCRWPSGVTAEQTQGSSMLNRKVDQLFEKLQVDAGAVAVARAVAGAAIPPPPNLGGAPDPICDDANPTEASIPVCSNSGGARGEDGTAAAASVDGLFPKHGGFSERSEVPASGVKRNIPA